MPVPHCPLPHTCHIHPSLIHPTTLSAFLLNQANTLLQQVMVVGNNMLTASDISSASLPELSGSARASYLDQATGFAAMTKSVIENHPNVTIINHAQPTSYHNPEVTTTTPHPPSASTPTSFSPNTTTPSDNIQHQNAMDSMDSKDPRKPQDGDSKKPLKSP